MRLIDAHCDTITAVMREGKELYDNDRHISLKKLSAFDAPVIFFAVFLHKELVKEPFSVFMKVYRFLEEQTGKNGDIAGIAKNCAGILRNIEDKKISVVPAIEEGGILEGKMENLYKVHELGVKYITLTWNFVNEIGEPSALNGSGLTSFGKDLLKEMGTLGILADVSHLSEKGFWDVYNLSEKPFIASHSNSKALCGHHRNLTDDQLKALGEKGGCAGVNINPPFLTDKGSAEIGDVCRHLDHMLKFAGEKHVGLGTDFDGIGSVPAGLEDVSKLTVLYDTLIPRYGKELTDRIFFGNFMDTLKAAEK